MLWPTLCCLKKKSKEKMPKKEPGPLQKATKEIDVIKKAVRLPFSKIFLLFLHWLNLILALI